ncbi:GNAT family N-acetyltransferase [Dermacoccaceae bacterium W4C1]
MTQPHSRARRKAGEISTRDLDLAPLTSADLRRPEVLRWHTAAEGFRLMAEEPYADADEFLSVASQWVRAWERGPSYWLASDRASGAAVGVGGTRLVSYQGREYLNLYYRLDPAARGRGLGRQIATEALAYAREWAPQRTVMARVAAANTPSLKVIRACGMREIGAFRSAHDPKDAPPPVLWQAPVLRTEAPSRQVTEQVLDLWCAVNAAGGAVGFPGEVPRAQVAAALDRHLEQMASGTTTLLRLHEPLATTWDGPDDYGALLGFGFLQRFSGPAGHRVNLQRVMIDPQQQGRGLGRVLVADLHARARLDGAEISTLDYRGGTGLGQFYAAAGYLETGRLVGGLRFPFGDRDDVQMAYWLNG